MSRTMHPYAAALLSGDFQETVGLMADDVCFHSPVISTPAVEGRDVVSALLKIANTEMKISEILYEYGDENAHVIVADGQVRGVDFKLTVLLEFDESGLVRDIWNLARPLQALVAIAEAIGLGFAASTGIDPGPAIASLKPLSEAAAVVDKQGGNVLAYLSGGKR